jgi:uncharacterized protein YbjT (DUF2867 family)
MAKKTEKTILVTGATGRQGGAVLRQLRDKKGFAVRALTRDPNSASARALVGHGTEVVRGDLDDPASLTRALDGVDGVYSVQALEASVEAEVRQGLNLIDAAARFRITQFVYSSVGSADKNTGIPHFDSKFRIEERLRASGLQHTVLRPVFFMENWLGMRDGINEGALASPLSPETRLQMIAVDDIGAFAAMAFDRQGHWQGRTVELAGDELSMTELAEAFSRMAGREVRYNQVPWDAFEQQAGHEVAVMFRWFERVGYHVDIPALRQEYANLTGFERWLQSNWAKTSVA